MSLLLASMLLVFQLCIIGIGIVLMLYKDVVGGSVLVSGSLIALAVFSVGHRIAEAILSASYN